MPKITPDIFPGEIFGSWEVLSNLPTKKEKYYECRCICGTVKNVSKSNLRLGKSLSCGKGDCKTKTITHGKSDHPLYGVWSGIKKRVKNPTGANVCYSGVSMCDEWTDFESFYNWAMLNGYEEGLSIDRIDYAGNYEPQNCRWTTKLVQSQNRRGHMHAEVPYKGVFKAKPRNGEVIYKGTGKAPYYFIVIFDGKRYQKWGFTTPEEAYEARCQFIEENFKGWVIP